MLSTLADLGEFIGGIAVIITILYFAIQLRANLHANRAQALASWTTAAQVEKEILFRDPEFARVYRQIVFEDCEPDGDERLRFSFYCIQFMNTWQLAYLQCQLGVMKPEFLDRVSNGYASFASNKHVQSWWHAQGSDYYDQSFVEYVDERIKSASQ